MASGKPTGLHFSLIFFVMATLILGVFLYVQVDDGSKVRLDLDTKTEELGKQKEQASDYLDAINELKAKIGYSTVAVVGTATDTGRDTVIGSMSDDIKKLGGSELARDSYAETLRAMKKKVDTVVAENANLVTKNQTLEVKFLAAIEQHYKQVASNHDQARKLAEQEREDANRTKETEIGKRDDQIVVLRGANTNLQNAKKLVEDKFNDLETNSKKKITLLSNINDYLTDAVRKRERITYDRPDGKIRWVDSDSGLVWINVGSDDKLTTRTQFSIYKPSHRGVGRPSAPPNEGEEVTTYDGTPENDDRFSPGFEDIKGSIEVTRVISGHLSEARILHYDIYDPIQLDDVIYTPLWDPGRPASFAFVGLIDFDNDGASNRAEMHEMIKGIGGGITHEVLDDGKRVVYTQFPDKWHEHVENEDKKIDLTIKYLVIGRIPEKSEAANDAQRQHISDIVAQHKQMISEARESAVRRINLSDFLAHIGYVPQRRLYVPGMVDRPYNLKSGAASLGVGGTIGDRSSSGKVSSLFTKSKRLKKQPVSTGKTSKRFQPGN